MINRSIKHGELFSKDRDYKVGDVLRWVPNSANWEKVEDKGLAVVIKASGPLFTVFWLGDESISEHDARWEGFKLQDLAALPQVVVRLVPFQTQKTSFFVAIRAFALERRPPLVCGWSHILAALAPLWSLLRRFAPQADKWDVQT